MSNATFTAVLGASPNPERYSNKAIHMLLEHHHQVIPVHPIHKSIDGIPSVAKLADIDVPVDTVTMYMNAKTSAPLAEELIALNPRRVIFNPGAESPDLQAKLKAAGIEVEEACTLVLLQSGQY